MFWSLSDVRRVVVRRVPLVLMRCVIEETPSPRRELELVRHDRWHPELLVLHQSLERETSEQRLRQRFARGLRFYTLGHNGATLATAWAVVEGERFVDELAVGFPVSDRLHWWRDIFVAPRARGRGLFAEILDAVLARDFAGKREMWSAVNLRNPPSLQAHRKRGFLPVCEYDVLQLMGWMALRLRWPVGPPVGSAYQPERRVVWTGPRYRRFMADHLA